MRGFVAFAGRALAIGLVFAVGRTVAEMAVAPAGSDPIAAFVRESPAAAVVGLWLAFAATRVVGDGRSRAAVVAVALFVNVLAVMIEGAAFQPAAQPIADLPIDAVLQLVVASLVGIAAILLLPRSRVVDDPAIPDRSAPGWLGRYLVCAIVYVVLYFVVGAINFTLVTSRYYDAGVGGLVVPPASVVLFVAVIEGCLLPIGVLPLLYALRGSRLRRALFAGTTIFVLGGVVPMILAPSLPLFLRVSSALEIFFQKFPVGVSATLFLGPED